MPCDSDSVWGALTRQFYAWQFRGRGWQVYDRPVSIEPPFRPFFGHFVAGINSVVDDGRKSMRLSSFLIDWARGERVRLHSRSLSKWSRNRLTQSTICRLLRSKWRSGRDEDHERRRRTISARPRARLASGRF
jgi:hypothetical protein